MWKWIKNILKKNKLVHKLGRYALDYFESIRGTRNARERQRAFLALDISLKKAIETIGKRWPELAQKENFAHDDSPVFILSAGWRSGSTLMQRLIMSKQRILIWGEPYNHAGLIQNLSAPIKSFANTYTGWPTDQFFLGNHKKDEIDLSDLWVANLFPDVKYLHQAGRLFIASLLKQPALDLGYHKWGMKEVRLSIDHACYLKWLYPNAKFIFMYRNPYKTYISYRPCRDWFNIWPDQPMLTPKDFARHWLELASGYIDGYKEIDGLLVKYEDLISGGTDMEELKEYLSVDINANVLAKKIGGSKVEAYQVPRFELLQIKKIVEPLASRLGYYYEDI